MDFKISEDIEEENKNNSKKDKGKFNIVIIIVLALIVGLIVFLIFNAMFNPKVKPKPVTPITEEKKSINDSTVKTLYQYVTYGTTGIRNDKYVKNQKVSLKDFTNEEKYYYGLMFVQVEDFEFTGEFDGDKNKIYSIPNRMIKKYIERYFGKGTDYSTDIKIDKYPYTFSINYKNMGTMRYDEDTDSFNTVFTKDERQLKEYLVEPYLGKLVEAYKEKDGSYRVVEKLVYVDVTKNAENSYGVVVSKDYEHNDVIETSTDLTEEDVKNIKIDKYIKNAATITYHFKLDGNTNILVFDYSEIK